MIFGPAKTLHDSIVERLLAGPQTVREIEQLLAGDGIHVTVQGIYKSLRELISSDIVVKQKTLYMVNSAWKEKTARRFARHDQFRLSEGEKIVYRFSRLEHLDAFWKHSFADIDRELGSFPVFGTVPHQYWSYVPGRLESEKEYYESFSGQQRHLFSLVCGTTVHDRNFKDRFSSDFHQVHLAPKSSANRRDHPSTTGPYVVTVRVSPALAKSIDKAYESSQTEGDLRKRLEVLFAKPSSTTMTIEHNAQKALVLRRQFRSYFHMPREIADRYELF